MRFESKLPRNEEKIKRFFDSCNNRKKFVVDVENHYKSHLKKAKHDLSRAIAEFNDNCWDWTVIKSYYSIHHAGNALLSKRKGLFSKDHYCLIIALRKFDLIDEVLFEELIKLDEKFSDIFGIEFAFQLRKISQYSVDEWEDVTKKDAKILLELAKRFINYVDKNV